jgi:hypothetical protein
LDIQDPKIVITGHYLLCGVIFINFMRFGRREQAHCDEHKLIPPVINFLGVKTVVSGIPQFCGLLLMGYVYRTPYCNTNLRMVAGSTLKCSL